MAVNILTGTAQVSLVFGCVGITDPMVTTFGVRPAGAALPASADSIANVVASKCTPTGKWLNVGMYSTSYSFLRIDVTHHVGGQTFLATKPINETGTLATHAPTPANCAILVQKRTAAGGRQHRGRMFLPPAFVAEGDVTAAGYITPATVTSLQARLTTFLQDLAAAEMSMCLLHSDPAVEDTGITSLVLQPLLATQRRRMR